MSKARRGGARSAAASAGRLPDAELEVLACLWQRGQATARQIREAMSGYRPMAHGSVMSLLKRLQAKGWVSRAKGPTGKAFIFRATRCPGPTHRRILRDLVGRIFGGNGLAVVSALFSAKPPTGDELDRLQRLLDELRAQEGKRESRP